MYLLLLLVLIYFVILLKTAWVADDAFLTLRSVDNFVNGYGLRWNILERVQIYTHPMWMFLLSGVYYLIRNPLATFYITAILISVITVYLVGLRFAESLANLILGFTILFLSKAFIDYSTSGLENPLTHLLIVLFLTLFFSTGEFSLRQVFTLFFIASLVAFNRMDTFLILVPSLLYVLYQKRSFQVFFYAGFGFLPFIMWEFFSLIYYGFLFPNTAYAKLATGLDKVLLIQQGYRYLQDSFLRDPITLVVILVGIFAAFFSKKNKDSMMAIGILLYLLYVVQIGGDFMGGRFLSALLLIAAIILMRMHYYYKTPIRYFSFLVLLILLRFYALSPYSLGSVAKTGIHDEKSAHFSITGLPNVNLKTLQPEYLWVYQGLEHKAKGRKLSIGPSSGMFAFYSGAKLHIVDTHALGDPLLSRLPPMEQNKVDIGHFFRAVPVGYWRFSRSFGNQIEDDNLRKYYEKLSVLIHNEKLISSERLIMIWRMNTGYYDNLLEAYLKNSTSR